MSLLVLIYACQKLSDNSSDGVVAVEKKSVDNIPDYGDTIIFARWKGPKKDYTIKPKKINADGSFVAIPQGMVIDPVTGEINVTKSEKGVRYKVGFVKANTTDTGFATLILGGITYLDHIYSANTPDTLAAPVYNANPSQAPVCNGNGNCEFDDDDDLDSPNGVDDEPPPGQSANKKHLRISTSNGVINLKKSLEDGLFGTNPQNGDTKLVTIYYRLNDQSGKVLQNITVQVTYYEKKSDIPVTTSNYIMAMETQYSTYTVVGGKPRPPQIVITRYSY